MRIFLPWVEDGILAIESAAYDVVKGIADIDPAHWPAIADTSAQIVSTDDPDGPPSEPATGSAEQDPASPGEGDSPAPTADQPTDPKKSKS